MDAAEPPCPRLFSFYSRLGSTPIYAARAPLAVAALLLAAACSNSPGVVAPEGTLKSGGWIGSGNSVATDPTQGEIGQIGAGNSVAMGEGPGQNGSGNSIAPTPTTERGGAGLIGSGNSVTPDSAFTAERGVGQFGSGN